MCRELFVTLQPLTKTSRKHEERICHSLKTLAEYCAEHGSFTRREFQRMFGVTRYRANQILTDLVSEEFPKYYRTQVGRLWVYRKTGT